jgi:hypothetical protein
LPIEPRQRSLESRIGEIVFQRDTARLVAMDGSGQLQNVIVELLDVALPDMGTGSERMRVLVVRCCYGLSY